MTARTSPTLLRPPLQRIPTSSQSTCLSQTIVSVTGGKDFSSLSESCLGSTDESIACGKGMPARISFVEIRVMTISQRTIQKKPLLSGIFAFKRFQCRLTCTQGLRPELALQVFLAVFLPVRCHCHLPVPVRLRLNALIRMTAVDISPSIPMMAVMIDD